MSLSNGFSIELGPELDPPYTREYGWVEDQFPEDPGRNQAKHRNSMRALSLENGRRLARLRAPRVTARAAMSTTVEISRGPDPKVLNLGEIRGDHDMGALQEIAEAQN